MGMETCRHGLAMIDGAGCDLGGEETGMSNEDVTMVRCPECGHIGRVVNCLSFACSRCSRVALTAEHRTWCPCGLLMRDTTCANCGRSEHLTRGEWREWREGERVRFVGTYTYDD